MTFHNYRSDPNFHYTFTMGRLPISTSMDDEPPHTLPYIPEDSDDDWDDHGDLPVSIPTTPPIPPTPPVSPSDVPGPSIPANPPHSPQGNQTFTKFKQKVLNFFQNL
jgi:hypothetical protein